MYASERENLIILSSFTQLSYEVKRRLLSGLEDCEPDFEKSSDFLIKTLGSGVYNKVRVDFYDAAYRENVLKNLQGIECVTYFSPDYPELLKHIDCPPILLYCKGDISLLKTQCFSVVGSRRSTPKALAECKTISAALSKAFTVVSGIAEGADSEALKSALNAGGKVISVLANGFDHCYPAVNAQLAERIANEGLLISEYPPEVQAKPYFFPVRNRIIAGLSKGTLVISASLKSGALITADYAADYGRDVFALPYSTGIESGRGCNLLIKNGAFLTENILDIFERYGLDCNTPEKNPLSDGEQTVLEAVRAAGEAFLPAIAKATGIPSYKLIAVLSSLEIKGRIVRLGGNRYASV